MTYSIIISTEDVYGLIDPRNPVGYAKTGEFRPPRAGEFFLNSAETSAMRAAHNHSTGNPRIILREMDEKELIIQEALPLLRSIYRESNDQKVWDLIRKAEEMLDV